LVHGGGEAELAGHQLPPPPRIRVVRAHGPPHRVRRPGARDGHRPDDPTSAARLAGRYPPLSGTATGVHHGGKRDILFDSFGGPDGLTLHTDSQRPEPAEGDELGEAAYAGVSAWD